MGGARKTEMQKGKSATIWEQEKNVKELVIKFEDNAKISIIIGGI